MQNKTNSYEQNWSRIGNRKLMYHLNERTNYAKPSPVLVDSYLESVQFPAKKADLIDEAKKHSAPQDVLNVLEQFEEKEYNDAIDVSKEVSRIY